MTVPQGLFARGGRQGRARQRSRPMVPLEWLRAHPLTKRWYSRSADINVLAAFVTRQVFDLQPGFEGYIRYFMIADAWNSGVNTGRNFNILVDGAVPYEAHMIASGGEGVPPSMDLLPGGTDGTNSWLEVDLWLPENAVVSVTYNNNGGQAADQILVSLYGYYWPITLREEWVVRGWKK